MTKVDKVNFFLKSTSGTGQRYCIYHPASTDQTNGEVLGMILYVHPFAEEMNKSRHVAAQQARTFSKAGFAVLQIDLLGCGDSTGEFEDASWMAWVQDLVDAHDWLTKRTAETTTKKTAVWLWGLRTGCLLALEASIIINKSCNFLFWQPSVSGEKEIKQFLRLKHTTNMLSKYEFNKDTTDQYEAQISIEILGYNIRNKLIEDIWSKKLDPKKNINQSINMIWIEINTPFKSTLSKSTIENIQEWKNSGVNILNYEVQSLPFWCTNEISNAPDLIDKSTSALLRLVKQSDSQIC